MATAHPQTRSEDGRSGQALASSNRAAVGGRTRRGVVASSPTSLSFDPLLPYDAWEQIGTRLGRFANSSAWWLGDWLVYGRFKYGREYKAAIASTGLDYQTLRNYAVVARRFTPARRRPELTFQHHAEVCALADDEQDRWLDLAGRDGWSRNRLRRELRGERTGRVPEETFRIAVEHDKAEQWREAARRSECNYREWIVSVLDEATRTVLGAER